MPNWIYSIVKDPIKSINSINILPDWESKVVIDVDVHLS